MFKYVEFEDSLQKQRLLEGKLVLSSYDFYCVFALCTRVKMMFVVYFESTFTLDKLKNMPDHDGNRTYDLWNASPMLCQLSYAVRSV